MFSSMLVVAGGIILSVLIAVVGITVAAWTFLFLRAACEFKVDPMSPAYRRAHPRGRTVEMPAPPKPSRLRDRGVSV